MKKATFTSSEPQQSNPVSQDQDPLVSFSTRLPKSYKRKFDTIAFHLEITKQDLLQRLIDAYPDQLDER